MLLAIIASVLVRTFVDLAFKESVLRVSAETSDALEVGDTAHSGADDEMVYVAGPRPCTKASMITRRGPADALRALPSA